MGIELNKQNVQRFYDEVIGMGDVSVIDDLMCSEFVHHGDALFPYIGGSEAIKQGVKGVKTAYPDGHTVIEDMVAEGDIVVVRLTWRGTHLGPFMGKEPTGKVHKWAGLSTYRFNNEGKIIERWANQDVMPQLMALGMIPEMKLGGG
ncbi:MAG: ester cyclase [Anaerolineae bacterium]|nr:ester cyclase [Anaerolineae bacterium]NUQ02829.1 ester cyclase [Anaerolineae bacterium]